MRKSKYPTETEIQAFGLRDLRKNFINEPTILYKVGDKVQHGNIKSSVVEEVLDNGKILLLNQICTDNNYGMPIDNTRKIYVAWHDVTPYRTEFPLQMCYNDDVFFSSRQCDIQSIFSIYYHFGLDMEVDYQRGNVWTPEDEVALIDSIFNNIRIGQFVFVFKGYEFTPMNECLDGKQRVTALVRFFENRFKYKGLTYAEMNPRDQSHFDSYPITLLESKNKMTQEQKYRYFLKLNTSGRPQDPNHIALVKKLWENAKC